MNVIALIPARGGSKSVPRKNVAPAGGKPLIAWTIATARRSEALRRVIVSTDDAGIAEVARACGAEVPFLRPPELAGDEATSFAVAQHALGWLAREQNDRPEFLMLLQPTSPLRSEADITGAIRFAVETACDAVLGVCEAATHPYLARAVRSDGTLADFLPIEPKPTRRQDFPPAYAINGALYLNRCATLLATGTFQPPGARPYVMPVERSLDIDSPWDLHLADLLLRDARA